MMKAHHNGSAPSYTTEKSAKKANVSLVEPVRERFESQIDGQARSPDKNGQDEYRQLDRERLQRRQRLQGSSLALAPAACDNAIAFTPVRSAALPVPHRSQALKYVAICTCAGAIAAVLLYQMNTSAVSAPSANQTFAGKVRVGPMPPSPVLAPPAPVEQVAPVAQVDVDSGLSLQLSTQLSLPSDPK